MKNHFLFIIIAFGIAFSSKAAAIDLTLQAPWRTKSFYPLLSVGVLFKSEKLPITYYKFGITAIPRFSYKTNSQNTQVSSHENLFSLYGLYGGYYLSLIPIFRPGIILGTVLSQNAHYSGGSSTPYEIHSLKLDYYAGLSVHVFCLTFIVTNCGIGGGLNFPLHSNRNSMNAAIIKKFNRTVFDFYQES